MSKIIKYKIMSKETKAPSSYGIKRLYSRDQIIAEADIFKKIK